MSEHIYTASELKELVRTSLFLGAKKPAPIDANTPAVVVLGAFDAVHKGHQQLLHAAKADANSRSLPLLVVSFSPDPAELFMPGEQSHILLEEDKQRGCLAHGADSVLFLNFTHELAALSPEDFVVSELLQRTKPVAVHVGDNFHFGAKAAGDVQTLEQLGERLGFSCYAHKLEEYEDAPISATRIRKLICEGELNAATQLLGRHHFMRGSVKHGRGEGTSLGFATANLELNAAYALPPEAVYAACVSDGVHAWAAAVNLGHTPTFYAGSRMLAEAHLLDFEGELYGEELFLIPLKKLRDIRSFSSIDELKTTVQNNILWVQEHFETLTVEVNS